MKKIKMIAHRGCPRVELENTKESFIAAGNLEYYGIETDITLIKNNSMIIYHDDDLVRLAGRPDLTRNMTLEEIKEVELNARPNYHTEPYRITTPLEYLNICKHYHKIPVIDIKWGFTNDALDVLMEMIKALDMYHESIIICYTMSSILYLRHKYPDYHLQFLAGMLFNEENVKICLENGLDLDVRHDFVTKELVERFHEKGLEVNCWTVDEEEDLKRVTECGVDYITSNVFR